MIAARLPRGGGGVADPERGAGLIGAIAGVVVFLAFLLFSVQLLVNLYATSTTTGAAWDGARQVAGARFDHGDPAAVATARVAAERRIRAGLGRFGQRVTIDWAGSDDRSVSVRVRGTTPRFNLLGLPGRLGLDEIDRTVRVRVETMR